MTRLVIHIGTHKTGTTSFQRFMTDMSGQYRARGVNFLLGSGKNGKTTANRHEVANAVLRPTLMTAMRMRNVLAPPGKPERVAIFDSLAQQVASTDATCHVLSAEAFCFARTRGEKRWVEMALSKIDATPEICVTSRNKKDWRDSWSRQISKLDNSRARGLPTLPHGEGFSDIRQDWYFNFNAICRFWQQFGTLHIVDYDEALARHGSIIPALMEAMDLPMLGNPEDYWKNVRR